MKEILIAVRTFKNYGFGAGKKDEILSWNKIFGFTKGEDLILCAGDSETYMLNSNAAVEMSIKEYGQGSSKKTMLFMLIPKNLKSPFVDGQKYSFWRIGSSAIRIAESTQEEIVRYSEPEHKPAVSGQIRKGRFLYLTQEEKNMLQIEKSSRVCITINTSGTPEMKIRRLFKSEASLGGYKQVVVSEVSGAIPEKITYAANYTSCLTVPQKLSKLLELNENNCMRKSVVGRSLIFKSQPRKCAVCNETEGKRTKVKVCKDCADELPEVSNYVCEGANMSESIEIAVDDLKTALAELDIAVSDLKVRAKAFIGEEN